MYQSIYAMKASMYKNVPTFYLMQYFWIVNKGGRFEFFLVYPFVLFTHYITIMLHSGQPRTFLIPLSEIVERECTLLFNNIQI